MVFEFLSTMNGTEIILLIVLFIVFVFVVRKLLSIVKNMLWIGASAVIFPLIANKLFGLPVPIDVDTILFFVILGEGAYILLLAANFFRFTSRILGFFASKRAVKPVEKIEYKKEKKTEENKPAKQKDFYKNYLVLEDGKEEHKPKTANPKKTVKMEKLPEIKPGKKAKNED